MKNGLMRKALIFFALPCIFYFIVFWILTYPLLNSFSTHFFGSTGDGFQNLWNIWWVNEALTELGTSPWYTTYLHHPWGQTMIAQTMSPFNGFLSIFLLKFLTLAQAHNFVVVFSFVIGGLTAFWLCYHFSRSWWSSILGGSIFTYSSFHFAHANGHLQMTTLEWIPLFLLLFWLLITKKKLLYAFGAAFALFLVILCDYYFFIYSVVTGSFMLLFVLWQEKKAFLSKKTLLPLFIFTLLSLVLCGPFVFGLLAANAKDPFLGAHEASLYGADLFSPFIPGPHWRFMELTRWYWDELVGETGAFMGLTVIGILVWAWLKRKSFGKEIYLLYTIGIIFGIFALGPQLRVFGRLIPYAYMPYKLLEIIFPFTKLSGVPIRMLIVPMLISGVVVAMTIPKLVRLREGKWLVLALVSFMIFEFLPADQIPTTELKPPAHVLKLKELPEGAVVDLSRGVSALIDDGVLLYYATVHEKPMAFGYVTRTPKSVDEKDQEFIRDLSSENYSVLCSKYKTRYLVLPAEETASLSEVFRDDKAVIYDAGDGTNCL